MAQEKKENRRALQIIQMILKDSYHQIIQSIKTGRRRGYIKPY